MNKMLICFQGLRVAQLHVIFKIPSTYNAAIFGAGNQVPGHLAYIEWFTRPMTVEPNSRMYPISRMKDDKGYVGAVVEIESIVRPCQLFPRYGCIVNKNWHSASVLQQTDRFFINNFADNLTYQTVY